MNNLQSQQVSKVNFIIALQVLLMLGSIDDLGFADDVSLYMNRLFHFVAQLDITGLLYTILVGKYEQTESKLLQNVYTNSQFRRKNFFRM